MCVSSDAFYFLLAIEWSNFYRESNDPFYFYCLFYILMKLLPAVVPIFALVFICICLNLSCHKHAFEFLLLWS